MTLLRRRGRPSRIENYRGLLLRLAALRVLTAEQARWLFPPWRRHSIRNARWCLHKLVEEHLLRAEPWRPEAGSCAVYFYRLTRSALAYLGLPLRPALLARPVQYVLDYLLLRNDVWAAARRDGYELAIRDLLEPEHHARALKVLETWALLRARAKLDRLRSQPRPDPEALHQAEQALERTRLLAPKALTFDFAYRLGPKNLPSEILLLVIADPRASVCDDDLPPKGYHGDRLLLRDSESRWNSAEDRLLVASPKLLRWRWALSKRYGRDFLSTDTLWPDLWAHRVGVPSAQLTFPTLME